MYLTEHALSLTAFQPSSASVALPDFNHTKALTERLQILRYVYGLSSKVEMSSQLLDHLWSLCTLPVDREAIMEFVAHASKSEICSSAPPENNNASNGLSNTPVCDKLHAVFSNEVSIRVFQNLFCASNVGWESLGEVAYQSFQMLYQNSLVGTNDALNACALDALWRICLSAGNDNVACQAMKDLLSLYSMPAAPIDGDVVDSSKSTDNGGNRFSKRIFDCLSEVKEGLQRGEISSERSAERCIRILKSAFEQSIIGGGNGAVVERLQSLQVGDLGIYLNEIPHGLRGISACKTIAIMGKVSGSNDKSQRFSLDVHPLQTVASVKAQIARRFNHDVKMVKLPNLSNRIDNNPTHNLQTASDDDLVGDFAIDDGKELIVILTDKEVQERASSGSKAQSNISKLDLSELFNDEGEGGSCGVFFDTLISVLESLPVTDTPPTDESRGAKQKVDTHSLVWDLLLAMPTNVGVNDKVQRASRGAAPDGDSMMVDSDWASLVDFSHFERSVYVMQVLDSFLRPPPHLFSSLSPQIADHLTSQLVDAAQDFRSSFIKSGGFEAVLRLFVQSGNADKKTRHRNRMGNACALRILSDCFLESGATVAVSIEGKEMVESFSGMGDFLKSLVYIIVDDEGVADTAILRVLRLVEMLLKSGAAFTSSFTEMPGDVAEKFLTSLLLWEGLGSPSTTSIQSAMKIRKYTEEMILATPMLSTSALPCLVKALKSIDPFSDGSSEFFSVLMKLVGSVNREENASQLKDLGSAVCDKLATYPSPNGDNEHIDYSTRVLCGCLRLLISLIEADDGKFLSEGSSHISTALGITPWSQEFSSNGHWDADGTAINADDKALVDLMGTIFDGFISSAKSPGSPPICCDRDSRNLAFNVVAATAQACSGGTGYVVLVAKVTSIISNVAPTIRHSWGQNASLDAGNNQRSTNTVKYSGLKNQGCTCYMNSFLQQLFMMPVLRDKLCSAEVPTILRSTGGGGAVEKGEDLVGKKISLHWDCGSNYDAMVDSYNEKTGMHTISYCLASLSVPRGGNQKPPDLSNLPKELPEEFVLSEGRPGKETGAFEILPNNTASATPGSEGEHGSSATKVKETEDEAHSRKLLEEVQRTFVNLAEARGRCFDPRSFVEASNCLKLEFDVWQQNDAAEFAMKLLDRLEISLKRWSPSVFKYLAHTFGLKTTKQKICKECGLKVRCDLVQVDASMTYILCSWSLHPLSLFTD